MKQHGDVTDYIEFGDKLVGKNLCTNIKGKENGLILGCGHWDWVDIPLFTAIINNIM